MFLKPVEFHFELADVLKQASLPGLRFRGIGHPLPGEDGGQLGQQFLLPLGDLRRMHLVLCRQGVNRLDALQGLQCYFRFELGIMLPSFLGPGFRISMVG